MERPTLFSLPNELLLEIVSYLHIPSTAAFALTSRRVYGLLSYYKWAAIRAFDTSTHMNVLELIQRGDPGWVLCQSCQSLHSTKEPARLRDLDIAKKLEDTDSDADDSVSVGSIMAPVIPDLDQKPEVLLEILRVHIRLVELRGFRYDPSGLFNKGLCLGLFAIDEQRSVSLPAAGDLDAVYATISYTTVPKLTQGNAKLMLHTAVRVTLLNSLLHPGATRSSITDEPEPFRQLRRVLQLLNLRCCIHCTPQQMANEVVCKLSQYILFSSECGCSQWQPERVCREHRHKCGCHSDVQVWPMASGCVEILLWQEWMHWNIGGRPSPVKRGAVRKKYLGHKLHGLSVTVNARWETKTDMC